MKILALSDLHVHFLFNSRAYQYYKDIVKEKFSQLEFDSIVITGDIFESFAINKWGFNPYETLRDIFSFTDKPIIFCLGNHEFAHNRVNDVIKFFEVTYDKKYNAHCLDVINNYQIDKYNFIGNVLFYDNSLSNNPFKVDDFIVKNWLDSTIIDFIPSKECSIRKQTIINNIKSDMTNILLTHCVPHEKLNWFSLNEPNSLYNQYSGCKTFLEELHDISWSFSGHTHKRILTEINGVNCVNVGNDYFDEFNEIKYYIAEIN